MALTTTEAAPCVKSYTITETKLNWDDSMAACRAMDENAHLAAPMSEDENNALWEMRESVGGALWIGHHEHDDEEGNRKWAWFDGSEMTYTNWHRGEPNDDAKQKKDCGELGRFKTPTWNDVPCTMKQKAICEIETCAMETAPEGFVDPLTVDLEPYSKAEHSVKVRAPTQKGLGVDVDEEGLYDHQCEQAIGHDGHYDEKTGKWILDNDYDAEPEWRCLMRPFLRYGVGKVEEAEMSIEAKTVVAEKKALIAVHERLVKEAEDEHKEAKCLEEIEQAIARFEECELRVLRTYSKHAESYPTSWVTFLKEKKACPDKFAEETKPCNPYFVW